MNLQGVYGEEYLSRNLNRGSLLSFIFYMQTVVLNQLAHIIIIS
jgi:hypothetical protein